MHLDTAMKNTSSEYSDVNRVILQFSILGSWIFFFFLAFVLPNDEKSDKCHL